MARDRHPLIFSPSAGISPSPKPMPSRPILKPRTVTFKPAAFKYPATTMTAKLEAQVKLESQETEANTINQFPPAPLVSVQKPPAFGAPTSTDDDYSQEKPMKKLKTPTGGLQTSFISPPPSISPQPQNHASIADIQAAPILSIPSSPRRKALMNAHKILLCNKGTGDGSNFADEVSNAPIFVEAVRNYVEFLDKSTENNSFRRPSTFSQYGLLGGDLTGVSLPNQADWTDQSDPRIFYNIAAPSSVFICGSQGSGKSHTLGCLLENCLLPSQANTLPRPLTGLVFHYDSFISDSSGSPCEAAFLSSNAGVRVRVLCSPTNTGQIQRIYSGLPNVEIEELRINEWDLNTQRMQDLMAVKSATSQPLYLSVINRILRELRIEQQANNTTFSYGRFKRAIEDAALTDSQLAPLQQRLETLESFMVQKQALAYDLFKTKPAAKNKSFTRGNDWTAQSGRLTIIDLSCPCITAEMACSLFGICLSLFLEQTTEVGRVVALDEAHKFMTNSVECASLTESLLATIRLQRHLGARVIISTQEPTISPRLLDLCSITIVHRFTSPDWLATLKQHLAGASVCMDAIKEAEKANGAEPSDFMIVPPRYAGIHPLSVKTANIASGLFQEIVSLNTGEALVFAPNAIIGIKEMNAISADATGQIKSERLGPGVLKVLIRDRVTQDGGRSIMAG